MLALFILGGLFGVGLARLLFVCGSFRRRFLLAILSHFPVILFYFLFQCFRLCRTGFCFLFSFFFRADFFSLFLGVGKFGLALFVVGRFLEAFLGHCIFDGKPFDLIDIVQSLYLF